MVMQCRFERSRGVTAQTLRRTLPKHALMPRADVSRMPARARQAGVTATLAAFRRGSVRSVSAIHCKT